MPNPTFTSSKEASYLYELRTPFSKDFNEAINAIPGVRWEPSIKARLVPVDVSDKVEALCRQYFRGPFYRNLTPKSKQAEISVEALAESGLRPYQISSLKKIIENEGLLLAHEQGVGKTPVAIAWLHETLGTSVTKQAVIVIPASVRNQWVRALDQWWPDHPKLGVLRPKLQGARGRPNKSNVKHEPEENPQIILTSFNMLDRIPEEFIPSRIVVDEVQFVKKPTSQWYKTINELRSRSPDCQILALTGTPIDDTVRDLFGILNLVWPMRLGKTPYKFNTRYTLMEGSEYSISGFASTGKLTEVPELAAELRDRLAFMSDRKTITDPDVRQYIPDLTLEIVRDHTTSNNESFANLMQVIEGNDEVSYEAMLEKQANLKSTMVQSQLDTMASLKMQSIVCVTWLKDTAKRIERDCLVAMAKQGYEVIRFDGDVSTDKRDRIVQEITEKMKDPSYKVLLICTMGSIAVGLNSLVIFHKIIFAELYYKVGTVLQCIKRFQRAGNANPVTIWFMILDGTSDEKIIDVVERKMKDAHTVQEHSTIDQGILKDLSESNEDLLLELRNAVNKFNPLMDRTLYYSFDPSEYSYGEE